MSSLYYSEYSPQFSTGPEKPEPPIYAGSYLEPSDQFYQCTLCGEQHVYHPACPHCGQPHKAVEQPSQAPCPDCGNVH